jgi:hypothetical protein
MGNALTALIGVVGLLWMAAVLCAIIFAIMRRWRLLRISGGTILGLTVVAVGAALLAPSEHLSTQVAHAARRAARTPTPTRSNQPFPDYLALRGGQHALLDSNNEGSGSKGTLFENLATVRKWASGQFNGPEDLPHRDFAVGTRVVVRSWTHVKAVGGDDYIMVKVMTQTNPQREGYVPQTSLLPVIPSGSRLVVRSSFRGSRGVSMKLRRDGSEHPPSLTIAEGTPVSLLAVAPNGDSLSPYRAQVLSGPNRGSRGWFDVFSLRAPSPPVSSAAYDEKCRCVSLYLDEVGPPAKQLRPIAASMPSAEPASPESSKTTRDYMNEACVLMYDGANYGFDFGSPSDNSNMRIVNCSGGDLVYFRREHLAETKSQYQNDKSPPNTPGGYPVPISGASGATPFPKSDK